jgi:phosphoglycerol transferase
VWWGYEDSKLFEFAKNKLKEISKKDEPFNFTLLTADTHFVDGYLDESCPTAFDDQYSNVFNCSDIMIYNFVKWIQKQDFSKNTTIIISGDHLTMQDGYYVDLPDNYNRNVYNIITCIGN